MSLRSLMARDHARAIGATGGMGEEATLRPMDAGPGQPINVMLGETTSPGTATGEAMLIQQRMVPVQVAIADARHAIGEQEGAERDLAQGDVFVTSEGRLVVESVWPDGIGFVVCQCRGSEAVGATGGRVL